MKQLLAQTPISNPGLSNQMQNLSSDTFLGNFISALVGIFLIVGTIAAFFLLLVGGLQFILSGGDKAGTEAAKNRITTAIVGLLLLFAAWAIIRLIEIFLGIFIFRGPFVLPTITTPI